MKKIFIPFLFTFTLFSCSKLKEVLPGKNKTSFKINGIEVKNPLISFTPYTSSGCSAPGTVSIEGIDSKGRAVELIIFNLSKMEGSNVTKKYVSNSCNTQGFLNIELSSTDDEYYDIPGGITFTCNETTGSLNISKITCESPFGDGSVTVEVNGEFELGSVNDKHIVSILNQYLDSQKTQTIK